MQVSRCEGSGANRAGHLPSKKTLSQDYLPALMTHLNPQAQNSTVLLLQQPGRSLKNLIGLSPIHPVRNPSLLTVPLCAVTRTDQRQSQTAARRERSVSEFLNCVRHSQAWHRVQPVREQY